MFSIKVLAVAAAVSAGVVLAMPAPSQAMPQAAPVKIDAALAFLSLLGDFRNILDFHAGLLLV